MSEARDDALEAARMKVLVNSTGVAVLELAGPSEAPH